MPKKSAVIEAFNNAPEGNHGRTIDVPLADAIAIIKSSAAERIIVSAGVWGVHRVDKTDILSTLTEPHLMQQCERAGARHGVPALVRLTISKDHHYRREDRVYYRVLLHNIACTVGDSCFLIR